MLGISAKLGLLNAKQVTDNCENLFEVLSTFAGLILVSQAEVRIRENPYNMYRKPVETVGYLISSPSL